MGLPQTMCLSGYVLIQDTNYYVTVKTLENNQRIARFPCDHELNCAELIAMTKFVDEMRKC